MDEALKELAAYVAEKLSSAVESWEVERGELTLMITREQLPQALRLLRDDAQCQFTCLIDICGVDYPERPRRFDVVYHLLSPRQNMRVRLKVETDEASPVPSAVPLFPAANWFERETFDLYGILFADHPDLRRILTDYGFQGYPLRKDFPLTGFVEVRYDNELKRVVYDRVKLQQEFRNFDFMSPWEGTEYILPGDEKAEQADKGKAAS